MIRFFLTCICLLAAVFVSCAQNELKEVGPHYHQSTIEFLLNLSEVYAKDGYSTSAARFKAYAEKGGGQGSGFVYKAKGGVYHLITNRHVVGAAESVTVEFEAVGGAITAYKNCSIVAVSKDVDLALVAFPAGAAFENAITLKKGEVHDGDEVFSAGFPDLGGNASWQLGKGIV